MLGSLSMMLDGRLASENIVNSITVPSEVVASVDNIIYYILLEQP